MPQSSTTPREHVASDTCPTCGAKTTKPRSEADHRRFFALIRAAFDQWPEGHDFQPDSAEHLRAWLLCKAGYRNCTTIPIEDDAPPAVGKLAILAIEAAIKAARTHAFPRLHGHGIAVFSAKSIAWNTLSQKDFGPLRQAVEDVISAEIGVDAETLLKQTEHVA